MSILWRLAGVRQEYMQTPASARYVHESMEHFGRFRGHPCVGFVSQVEQRWGAPMALAVHVTDTVNLDYRVPLEPIPEGILRNWGAGGQVRAGRVVEEARSFVAEADFDSFWHAREPLYREAESRYRRHVESEADLEWLARTFGHQPGLSLNIILCLGNGDCCYPGVVALDEGVEYYCFLGTPNWDEEGVPVPNPGCVGTIVHEFVHLYTDASPYLSLEGMREAGERLLERARGRLDMEAYGEWEHVIAESVANAWEVRYLLATRGKKAADECAADAVRKGFVWTAALSELFGEYKSNRSRYPDFGAFAPQLGEFFREEGGR